LKRKNNNNNNNKKKLFSEGRFQKLPQRTTCGGLSWQVAEHHTVFPSLPPPSQWDDR